MLAGNYRELDFDPLDDTKRWPEHQFPLLPVGRMVLDRSPDNFFAETGQSAFGTGVLGDGIDLEQGLPANLRNHKGDSLLMLDFGADPELCNDQGQAPLAGAAYKSDAAMASLLERGANVEGAMPGGRTALMMAAMFNRRDVVALLLQQGAKPDARDAGGLTALDAARIMGAPDTPQQIAEALSAASC